MIALMNKRPDIFINSYLPIVTKLKDLDNEPWILDNSANRLK